MARYNDSSSSFMIAAFIMGIVFLLVMGGWAIRSCSTVDKATLGVVDLELDRRSFERSQSYREGLRRDFDELMRQYVKARSDDERTVIMSTLRHRVAGAPPEAVPTDVKDFIKTHTK